MGGIDIDRLRIDLRMACEPGRAEPLARRVRDAVVAGVQRTRAPPALHDAPAYVFIERVAFDCPVSSAWDDEAIGAAVSRGLAAALEASAATIAFRDRPELLAAFYVALADGHAWQRWWFAEFDGLRALPASAALRTSVINEEEGGWAALARLTADSRARVLEMLSGGDAGALLERLERRSACGEPRVELLWRLSASLQERAPPARWVAAALAAESANPGAAGGETLRTLRSMASLRAAAARGGIARLALPEEAPLASLRQALASLSLEAAWTGRLAEAEAHAMMEELRSACTPDAAPAEDSRRDHGAVETPAGHATPAASSFAAGEREATRRGGALLLLKTLHWLDWPAMWRRAMPQRMKAGDADALARALALHVVARALDPRGAARALDDRALRLAFGVDEPRELLRSRRRAAASALQASGFPGGTSAAGQRLLAEFAQRVPGLAGSSPRYLRQNALCLTALVECREGACRARLGRAPLDVLLALAGCKRGRIALPGGVAIELAEDLPS